MENPYNRGEIGNILVDALSPIIGNIGLYLFIIFGLSISVLVLYELSDYNEQDLQRWKHRIKLRKNQIMEKISKVTKDTTEISNYPSRPKSIVKKEVYEPAQKTVEQRIKEQQVNILKANIAELKKQEEEIYEEQKDQILEEYIVPLEIPSNNQVSNQSIIVEELEENRKLLSELEFGKIEKPKDFILPPTNFFQEPPKRIKQK